MSRPTRFPTAAGGSTPTRRRPRAAHGRRGSRRGRRRRREHPPGRRAGGRGRGAAPGRARGRGPGAARPGLGRHPQGGRGRSGHRRRRHAGQRRVRLAVGGRRRRPAWAGWRCTCRASPRTMQAGTALRRRGAPRCATSSWTGRSRPQQAGVDEVWIDPGFGFGKTLDHNLTLLRHLDGSSPRASPWWSAPAASRFLGQARPAARPAVDDRLEASLATAAWAWPQGARMVRVHDVAADGGAGPPGVARGADG